MDSILRGLKAAGASIRKPTATPTQVAKDTKVMELHQEPIQVSIQERIRQRRRTANEVAAMRSAGSAFPATTEYLPSGNLTIKIGNSPPEHLATWTDTKAARLEEMLGTIGPALLALPARLKVARAHRLAEEQRARESEQLRWKAEQLERRKDARLAELLKEAREWDDLEVLSNYLSHLEKQAASGTYVVTEQLTRGLARARELLPRLDPTERRIGILQWHGMVTLSESAYGGQEDDEGS